jgi:signal transduction histidine kinase
MKLFIFFLMLVLIAGVIFFETATDNADFELDIVGINIIVKQNEENWRNVLSGWLPDTDGSIRFTFVPADLPVNSYIARGDTLIDVIIDGEIAGKVVIFNASEQRVKAAKTRIAVIFYILTAILVTICGLFALYQYKTILQPFRKLENFALRVAQGDLSIPLDMDRKNRFGAFTESFDLMREQLAAARENERLANISKKELVASLSHDIKTPVASIKAIAELYQAKHGDISEISAIAGKADQIDLLISNMFTATLEELKQLKVSPEDIASFELADIIRSSDYENKIGEFIMPECVVTADKMRFRQVVDNIIGNSYKYAGTDIEVSARFEKNSGGNYLTLTFRDFGSGVASDELSLLCEKFYRAKNSEGKSGSGLGLYLSEYFIAEMGGTLDLENNNGLWIIIRLKI